MAVHFVRSETKEIVNTYERHTEFFTELFIKCGWIK
jgi:hypothetical protein